MTSPAGIADACLAAGPLASPVDQFGGGRITRIGVRGRPRAAFPGCRIRIGDRFRPGRNVLLDIEAARTEVGYDPRYDVPTVLADVGAIEHAT